MKVKVIAYCYTVTCQVVIIYCTVCVCVYVMDAQCKHLQCTQKDLNI